jgi:hypothetical protein
VVKGMKGLNRSGWLLAALSVLVACGGDGSGMVPAAQQVTITSANAGLVTSDALNAAVFSMELGGLGGGILAPAPGDGLLAKISGRVSAPTALVKLVSPIWQVTLPPFTLPCAVSGTITVSGTIADPATLTAGDTVSADFAVCDDGDGVVLSGGMDLVVNSVVGELIIDEFLGMTGSFELTMTVTLSNLSSDDGGQVSTANGSFTTALDTRNFPILSTSVSGTRLALTSAIRNITLENFDTGMVEDLGAGSFELTGAGRVSGSLYTGYADYTTEVTFVGVAGFNPSAGEMLIRGAGGTSVRLVTIDEQSVRLEIDTNGDGTVDETRTISWDEAVG